ncbi:MAG: hypothetical protein PHI55_11935 [Burkholderiaceae bacterium]|nr:hypothetical protein [Burkholderiaceae bacterium]
MRDYFLEKFPIQLQGLKYQQPHRVVRQHILRDEAVVFFGGRDWTSVSDDLSKIPSEDRPPFILSLFMVVLADQWWYYYRPNLYDLWRKENSIPKFGWSGLGPHNENPFKLLWAPEKAGLVVVDDVLALLPHFVLFMFWKAQQFRYDDLMWRDSLFCFESIKRDRAYQFSQGRIVHALKKELDAFRKEPFFPAGRSRLAPIDTLREGGFDAIGPWG